VTEVGQARHEAGGAGGFDAARSETETLEGSRPFQWLVRAGFIARAITYGVIGALALAIALGAGTMGTSPNQQGALVLIAHTPVGRPAMVAICAGLLAYALWKFTQALFGYGPEGGGGTTWHDRIANLAGGLVYLGFLAVAILALMGSSGNSSGEPRHAARDVLGWPGGEVMIGIVGVVLMGISLYQIYDAVRGGYARDSKTEQMNPSQRTVFMVLGRVGLTARALVFGLIGYFLVRTAVEFNATNAIGVDGALAQLHHQPLGRWLVGVVAAGLLTFSAFSLVEGRYRRL
jgi:Domain of Unknown Function (DUF1206)